LSNYEPYSLEESKEDLMLRDDMNEWFSTLIVDPETSSVVPLRSFYFNQIQIRPVSLGLTNKVSPNENMIFEEENETDFDWSNLADIKLHNNDERKLFETPPINVC
jgi:hypothetical protein